MSGANQRNEKQRDGLVDVMVDAVLAADIAELAPDRLADADELSEQDKQLRARFLARVAHAQAATTEASQPTLSDCGPEAAEQRDDSNPGQPNRIGRYPILRLLGSGGMGVVYAAYDEVLDRRLALKVLHHRAWDGDGRRRERLLREAQAMARVAHPNLVTVHEVGTASGQLFVAMEFVAGPTLKQWLAERQRGWREIVPVFIQIAEGLAALHDAGLVHRDVKPANVIIGDDGRVRVLDLGLVGAKPIDASSDGIEVESSSSHNRLDQHLTMTGERVGTPAYMSREQFLGLELTPASDIFAFSVVLYEALFGVHPFKASTFYELQARVVENQVTLPPAGSSVPAWLSALVMRGFAPDPSHRPPSMRAYASALAQDPERKRRRVLATIGAFGLALLSGLALAYAMLPEPAPRCDGGAQVIAEVWDQTQSDAVDRALNADAVSYAAPLAERVRAELDDYASSWAAAHNRVCIEHGRGDHSDALLDARMACLDRSRQAFAQTVSLLSEPSDELLANAGQMVAKLPRLEPCDDLTTLSTRAATTSPALAGVLGDLDRMLVRVDALANAGRPDDAVALARSVAARAEEYEHQPTLAAALLAEARTSIMHEHDLSSTSTALDRALAISLAHGLDALAAEAMIRRLYVRSRSRAGSETAIADFPIAEALLSRSGNDPELHALLENNAGSAYLVAGERALAQQAFERALARKEQLFGEDHLETAIGLANLAIAITDETERARLHARMIEIFENKLGPEHPRTLDARFLAAVQREDPQTSSAALRALCPRFLEIEAQALAGECELQRARREFARGELEFAHEAFLRAREQMSDDDLRTPLVDAYLALGSEAASVHVATLQQQLDDNPAAGWWEVLNQCERRLLIAWLQADPAFTLTMLEPALAKFDQIVDNATPSEHARLLALTQSTLALALAEQGEPARARELAATARSFFERWPTAYAKRLATLEGLR